MLRPGGKTKDGSKAVTKGKNPNKRRGVGMIHPAKCRKKGHPVKQVKEGLRNAGG